MRPDTAAREVATLHVRDVPASVSRLAVLGSKIWDWWHPSSNMSLSSNTVTAWAGMYRNTSLPKLGVPNQPPYSVDGVNFRGKRCVQFANSGTKFLQLDSGSDLLATTDKPVLICVGRLRSLSGTRFIMAACNPGFTVGGIELQLSGGNMRAVVLNADGTLLNSGATDTAAHMLVSGLSGTQLIQYQDAAAITPSASTTGNFGAALRTISIGGFGATGTDYSCAEFGILTAVPTAGEWTALRALFSAEWATP